MAWHGTYHPPASGIHVAITTALKKCPGYPAAQSAATQEGHSLGFQEWGRRRASRNGLAQCLFRVGTLSALLALRLLSGTGPCDGNGLGDIGQRPRGRGRVDFNGKRLRFDSQAKFGGNKGKAQDMLTLAPRGTLLPGMVAVVW
jgi:hypothetical protein